MSGVGLFAGQVIRTWDIRVGSKEHVLRLHHHTVSGRRYLVLDGAEVFGSRGSTSVVSLEAAGHVLPFSLSQGVSESPESSSSHANIGYVKILPHGSTGFSYHCFVDDARVMERGEALSSTRLAKPFVTISIPATEVHADATGTPVSFYRMDVMSETRGTSMHKRFSDFFQLNEALRAAYKGSPIMDMLPAMPPRSLKFMADHSDPTFVAQRRLGLERFVSGLAHLDIMRTNADFLAFIGLTSSDGVLRDRTEVIVGFPAGPMGLTLKSSNRVNEPAEIAGFKPLPSGGMGPAQASGKLHVGDVLSAVNGTSVLHMTYNDAIRTIKSQPRPVKLHFLTMEADTSVLDDEAKTQSDRSSVHQSGGAAVPAATSQGATSAALFTKEDNKGASSPPHSPTRTARVLSDPATPVQLQPMRRKTGGGSPLSREGRASG